jgi:hypothetical protein
MIDTWFYVLHLLHSPMTAFKTAFLLCIGCIVGLVIPLQHELFAAEAIETWTALPGYRYDVGFGMRSDIAYPGANSIVYGNGTYVVVDSHGKVSYSCLTGRAGGLPGIIICSRSHRDVDGSSGLPL